jgi:hypothetical protein
MQSHGGKNIKLSTRVVNPLLRCFPLKRAKETALSVSALVAPIFPDQPDSALEAESQEVEV